MSAASDIRRRSAAARMGAADLSLAGLATTSRLIRLNAANSFSDTGATVPVVDEADILRITRLDPEGGLVASSGTAGRYEADTDSAKCNVGYSGFNRGWGAFPNFFNGSQGPWSIAVRARTVSIAANRCLWGASNNAVTDAVLMFATPSNQWTLQISDNGASNFPSSTAVRPNDGWCTVTAIYDGDTYVLNVNGEQETNPVGSGKKPNTLDPPYLGSRIRSGLNWFDPFNGYIGASLFVDYAMTPAQCARVHNQWAAIWN